MTKSNNRSAVANCPVLSESSADHVSQQNPWKLKKRELQGESLDMESLPTLKAPNPNQGLNEARQTWTAKQRKIKGGSTKAI